MWVAFGNSCWLSTWALLLLLRVSVSLVPFFFSPQPETWHYVNLLSLFAHHLEWSSQPKWLSGRIYYYCVCTFDLKHNNPQQPKVANSSSRLIYINIYIYIDWAENTNKTEKNHRNVFMGSVMLYLSWRLRAQSSLNVSGERKTNRTHGFGATFTMSSSTFPFIHHLRPLWALKWTHRLEQHLRRRELSPPRDVNMNHFVVASQRIKMVLILL